MLKPNKKKGFTIVELVIVIAVVGVLTAVLVPTFVNLTNQARKAENQTFVRNLNTQMGIREATEGKNETMYEAMMEAEDIGYNVEKLTPVDNNDVIWDSVANRFAIVKPAYATNPIKDNVVYSDGEIQGKGAQLWKIYANMPETQTYSIYAKEGWNMSVLTTAVFTVGFDAGKNNSGERNVSFIKEASSSSLRETVNGKGPKMAASTGSQFIIRTSSYLTTLSVDAPQDELVHYGRAKEINVIRIKDSEDKYGYDERGDVIGNVKVAQGSVNIANGGSAANVVLEALTDYKNQTVTPTAETVRVSAETGSSLNAVIAGSTASGINVAAISKGTVTKVSYDASAFAFTADGTLLTSPAQVGAALQGSKRVTLLKNVDLADPSVLGCDGSHRNCLTNPIKVSTDFDLNGFKATVLHMSFVVDVDGVKVSNGEIYTALTTYGDNVVSSRPTADQIANNQAIKSYDLNNYDRYGVVIQGDNVVLAGLHIFGGVSLGGDKGANVSYTPVNTKGTNSAYNTNVIGCELIALNAPSRKSIYAQSGSNGAKVIDSTLTGGASNQGLLFIVGGLGDMGSAGDKNELSFNNVKCNVNPLTEAKYNIGGTVQFEIKGDITGTRHIVAKTSYASSDAVITYDGTNWYLNGTLGYIIH